jgi:hypothetical protein
MGYLFLKKPNYFSAWHLLYGWRKAPCLGRHGRNKKTRASEMRKEGGAKLKGCSHMGNSNYNLRKKQPVHKAYKKATTPISKIPDKLY